MIKKKEKKWKETYWASAKKYISLEKCQQIIEFWHMHTNM